MLFYFIANIIAWFGINLQFMNDWWTDKEVLSAAIFSFPVMFLYTLATKEIVNETGLLWSSKLIGFGVSNVVFAFFTWTIMKEGMFNPKTLICFFLSVLIILTQLYWKSN
tara:strand:+ start:1837 stop:2166 length:330 start_codon:yes stop_codon:yes gene_type:complete